MTIFDVIRYPISDPPQTEELAALPLDLYWDWIQNHTRDWRSYNEEECEPGNVALWMHRFFHRTDLPATAIEIRDDIQALRRLIAEYNEPV